MNYYMVIATHIKTSKGVITSREIYNKMKENNCWEFSERAPHFKKFDKGDILIFYLAGEGERQFVGSAEVINPACIKSSDDKPILEEVGINFFTHRIPLKNMKTLKKPKLLKQVAKKLSFMNFEKLDFKHLGLYLRIGIRKLTEEDYKILAEE